MEDNAYRRNVRSGYYDAESASRDSHGDRYNRYSHRSPSNSCRGHSSQSINLKALKNTSLTCAKSLTNKLISLSNSGIQAASSAINSYRETAAANACKVAVSNPNSFISIALRINSTDDPIASHRELVAVIEHLLIWSNPPIQLTLERDRCGLPTAESMRSVNLINMSLLEKVLVYVEGRRDCCLFIIKFVTWRIRTTSQPEEVILSLELMQYCAERFGGYFLALMTKSCMRRFRRLLRMTKLTTSLAGGVKKQLTKLIIGSSNMHPGVPTDIRIHVIKAKVLYMVQLWHDALLLEQGMYPVFFQGYREMRERGIKFPQIDVSERSKINMTPVIPKSRFTIGTNIVLPLTPAELDSILNTVNTISKLPPGPDYDAALGKLKHSKERIVSSINILVEQRGRVSDPHNYEELMKKMLMLNDCVGAHLQLGSGACKSSSQLLRNVQSACTTPPSTGRKESSNVNLLDLDSSSDSDNNDDFDKMFGFGMSETERKKSEDDYDKFFAEFGVFDTCSKASVQSTSPRSDTRQGYASDLGSLDFGNPVAASVTVAPSSARTVPDTKEPTYACKLDYDSASKTDSGYLSASSTGRGSMQPPVSAPPASETKGAAEEAEPKKKSLNELMKDFDNMEHDFSHMSVTGF